MKYKLILGAVVIAFIVSCSSQIAPLEPAVSALPKTPTPKSAPAPSEYTPENIAYGKSLYEAKCGNCHRLYGPKEFSKDDWDPILKSMQPKAKYDDIHIAAVKLYIHSVIE